MFAVSRVFGVSLTTAGLKYPKLRKQRKHGIALKTFVMFKVIDGNIRLIVFHLECGKLHHRFPTVTGFLNI